MITFEIKKVMDNPGLISEAAHWFHSKWGIPLDEYKKSMYECLNEGETTPQWYVVMHNNRIIAGIGIIENDFHDRKDLTPNICSVYVDVEFRGQGIAGKMLNFVCDDMKNKGIHTLYLVTDLTSFYERYNWKFLCMVQGDGEPEMARMYIHTIQ